MSAVPDRLRWCHHCYQPLQSFDLYCSEACRAEDDRRRGRRLEIARMQLGLTAEQMAGKLEMSRRAYRAWELGHRREFHMLWATMVYAHEIPISFAWLDSGHLPMTYPAAEMAHRLECRQRRLAA